MKGLVGMYFDWTYIVMILPATILAMYAQMKVNSTFKKYSNVSNRNGYTAAEVARMLLTIAGINDVSVEQVAGNLTDHYDPKSKALRLSDSVYQSKSLAAIGVAAHETGHAIQHDSGYMFLNLRNLIFPVASFSSKLAGPLILLGFLLAGLMKTGYTIVYIGIILFTAVVFFQIITLPVEFNASSRAIEMLKENNILYPDEIKPAKSVLSAAALTYVASAAVAILTLLRYIMILNGRNRRD